MAHLDFDGLDGVAVKEIQSLRVDFSSLLVCSQWWHVEVGDPSLSPCEELQAPGGAMVLSLFPDPYRATSESNKELSPFDDWSLKHVSLAENGVATSIAISVTLVHCYQFYLAIRVSAG
ncbi:hypothetical protein IGI04_027667 [Brassica rapa subsp. trilocularis]|uniref:Uncharacterized protein n=1 Tax=Brassica rapa subsp. trilocularis TaxID=1813537 RepID=A0ABQ7L2F0_BRACM|nr:hypothetical protein IGI04_027667 [Brassica rapa subsp. trilocularis]